MAVIDTILLELQEASTFESKRVTGYTEILSLPTSLLTAGARAEVSEALAWSTSRLQQVLQALTVVSVLKDGGYPGRLQQVAPDEVIAELLGNLQAMKTAIDEFQPPPVGSATVSEEIPL